MKVLFVSKNLIGDALNIYPALSRFHKNNPNVEIDMFTLPDQTATLYKHMGVPLKVITTYEELGFDPEKVDSTDGTGYDMIHEFNANVAFTIGDQHKCHISIGYAMALPVKLEIEDLELKYDPPVVELTEREKGLFLISPFSKSCSGNSGQPPNKMLPWSHWAPIISTIRSMGGRIGCLGSKHDRAMALELSEDEYLTGLPFDRVAHIMRSAKILVTIDNGMAHLGASQKATMLLFYPACLGLHWIVPIGNPNLLQVIQLDPATVDVSDLVIAVKRKITEKNLVSPE